MLNKTEIKRILPVIWFFLIYSVLFFIWSKFVVYTLPFIIGFIVAAALQPAACFLNRKCNLSKTTSSIIITASSVLLILTLLIFLGAYLIQEAKNLVIQLSNTDLSELSEPFSGFFTHMDSLFGNFSADYLENNQNVILDTIKDSMDMILAFFSTVLYTITSIPFVITMGLTTVFSIFFLTKDMEKLGTWFRNILSDSSVYHVKSAAKITGNAGKKSFPLYLLIYFITFCETLIISFILGLEYPFTLALITAVADIIPILGPGLVFLPVAIYQLLLGHYGTALGLLVGYLLITFIREIIEPKLVSPMTRIHPLAMITAIYFSFAANSFLVMIYITGFFMLYGAFKQSGALPYFINPAASGQAADAPPATADN